MLIWKRDIPKYLRSLMAIGTLSAMVALSPAMRYSTALGQEPTPLKEQNREQTKEQKPPPVKGSEEKEPVKKSDETGPVKGTKEKEPIKKPEEQQQEGRGDKSEKAPQKRDEKAPAKGNEKTPIRGEEKGTDAAANVKESVLEGQLIKISGNMLMMTSKGGKEHSLRLMEDARLTLEGKVFRAAELKTGMIIRVTTLPPDHGRVSRIEVLDQIAEPAANTRLPTEGTPGKEMSKEGQNIPPAPGVKHGTLQYDEKSSTTCGPGKICFNFSLPTKVSPRGNQTGTGEISLAIYKNGMPVQTGTPPMPLILTSGKLTGSKLQGSNYCFQITPAILSGLNPSLGGFDFVAKGKYVIEGTTVNIATVQGSDYKIVCPPKDDDKKQVVPQGHVSGSLQYDATSSTICGAGKICFKYTLPTKESPLGIQTGTGMIKLEIYQNGVKVNQLISTTLTTTPGSYCFQIDAAVLNALTQSLVGFDFVAIGTYSFGATVFNTETVGAMSNGGQIPKLNNDYKIFCGEDPGHPIAHECCLGRNLVQNGDFESNVAIVSQYQPAGSMATLKPGTYIKYKVDYIKEACSNWQLPKECSKTKDFDHEVLFVNGLTNQIAPAPASAVIWEQQIPVSEKKEKYRVCFRYLPLPQCCFNVVAKPTIKVTSGLITLGLTDVSDVDTGCGRLFSATYEAGGAGVNLSIILPQQNVMDDGNDLMIDNISVAKLESVPSELVDFKIEGGTNVGEADVTILGPLASPFTWEWQLWTGGPGLPNGTAVGPAVIGGATHTFTGLSPDVIYYVTLKVKSPCHKQTGKYLNWGYGTRSVKAAGKPMDILDADAAKTEKGPETPKRRNE